MIDDTDAFGRALLDWVGGGTEPEIHEREDGYVEAGAGPELYLSTWEHWPEAERLAVAEVSGRVLDLGCGAGRVAMHFQQRGCDVVAVDSSTCAVRAARAQGVRRVRRMGAESLDHSVGSFDTVVLFGNNAGIFGTPDRLRRALHQWSAKAEPGSRILLESTSPYHDGVPVLDAGYRRANRRQGRMPGQLRMRTRYRTLATEWFWWLYLSPAEMRRLVTGSGWRVAQLFAADPVEPYVAVLEPTP